MKRLGRIPTVLLAAVSLAVQSAQVGAQDARPLTWHSIVSQAESLGRVPTLSPGTGLSECLATYDLPDSIVLVSQVEPPGFGPPVWTWSSHPGAWDNRPSPSANPNWRSVPGPTASDTLPVRVLAPACDWNLRERATLPATGDLSQLLVERDGAVLGIGVRSMRSSGLNALDFYEVFVLDDRGQPAEASLVDVGAREGQDRRRCELRRYDAAAERAHAIAALDSVKAAGARRDSIADAERRAEIERREDEQRLSVEREYAARERRIRQTAAELGWSDEDLAWVLSGLIRIGMTEDMVRAALGRPSRTNRTTTRYGTHEQWVYDRGVVRYVYLDDGVVTAIQR